LRSTSARKIIVGVRLFLWLIVVTGAACAGRGTATPASAALAGGAPWSLAAEVVLRAPANAEATPYRLGGLSGLAPIHDGRELLAISDDHESSRVVRLRVTHTPAWQVEPAGAILLETGTGAPARLDPEGIVVTLEGHLLISSEGVGHEETRLPPAIVEYSADGRFIRQLAVRPRYAPNPQGPIIRGVRSNSGFESLTASPDFSRLFTASELPLAQDGEAEPFAPGSRTRLLEYVRGGGIYQPAREFAYDIEPLERPAYPVRFAVNGLVELLALSRTELLALERGYVESEDRAASANRIRLYRLTIDEASDISGLETLRGASRVVPVRKTLVADLNALPGLSPSLRNLDNFEGLAWGPAGRDGVRPLVLVSDDNFNARQVTAFLFLRP
jgi:hypothetical protein